VQQYNDLNHEISEKTRRLNEIIGEYNILIKGVEATASDIRELDAYLTAEFQKFLGSKEGSQWATQDRNSNATVRVSGGYNRRSHGDFNPSSQRTDVEIFDKTADGNVEKTHLSIDSDGNRTVWHGNETFGV